MSQVQSRRANDTDRYIWAHHKTGVESSLKRPHYVRPSDRPTQPQYSTVATKTTGTLFVSIFSQPCPTPRWLYLINAKNVPDSGLRMNVRIRVSHVLCSIKSRSLRLNPDLPSPSPGTNLGRRQYFSWFTAWHMLVSSRKVLKYACNLFVICHDKKQILFVERLTPEHGCARALIFEYRFRDVLWCTHSFLCTETSTKRVMSRGSEIVLTVPMWDEYVDGCCVRDQGS